MQKNFKSRKLGTTAGFARKYNATRFYCLTGNFPHYIKPKSYSEPSGFSSPKKPQSSKTKALLFETQRRVLLCTILTADRCKPVLRLFLQLCIFSLCPAFPHFQSLLWLERLRKQEFRWRLRLWLLLNFSNLNGLSLLKKTTLYIYLFTWFLACPPSHSKTRGRLQ